MTKELSDAGIPAALLSSVVAAVSSDYFGIMRPRY